MRVSQLKNFELYFKLFGKRFFEYQVIIPENAVIEFLNVIYTENKKLGQLSL